MLPETRGRDLSHVAQDRAETPEAGTEVSPKAAAGEARMQQVRAANDAR